HAAATAGQERLSCQLRSQMRQNQPPVKQPMPRSDRGSLGIAGTAAVEFAFAAPILVTLVMGIADLGLLAARSAALAGATRIGAEYARANSTCQSDVYATSCITGIKNAMQNSGNFSPALTFPSGSSPFPAS